MEAGLEGRLRDQFKAAFKTAYLEDDGYILNFASEQYFHTDTQVKPNEIDVIVKDTGGQILFGNRIVPVSVFVISEQDSLDAARSMMQVFVSLNNQVRFSYLNDSDQTRSVYPLYNAPTSTGNFESVGAGLRSVLYMGGVLVVTENALDIESVQIGTGDAPYTFIDIPFIQAQINFSSVQDTQAWYGNNDMAQGKVKWGTLVFGLSMQSANTDFMSTVLSTMVNDSSASNFPSDGVRHKYYFKIAFDNGIVMENNFILTSANYGKEIGGIPTMSMSFTLAQ